MSLRSSFPLAVLTAIAFVSGASRSSTHGARDPDFGESFAGLSRQAEALFEEGLEAFSEEEDQGDGLGPIFNDVGCAACHSVPKIGGSSPINETRAARVAGRSYVELPGGSLFQTNALRPDCAEAVPAEANVREERQTQPLFGLGLVEAIPDWQIETCASSSIRAIDGQRVEAFSDLLLHDVGTGDGIVQGEARGSEFRTAPLWGLASSAPYLHDGRAATVTDAIRHHSNQGADSGRAFAALSRPEQEALLELLGSI